MKIHHFAFEVSDLEKSIRFYEEVFGLELTFRETDPAHGESFAILSSGAGGLELLQRIGAAEPFRKAEVRPPYCPHLAFETEDLDRSVRELLERGVKRVAGPFDSGKGIRWAYLADPDDNVVELIEVR